MPRSSVTPLTMTLAVSIWAGVKHWPPAATPPAQRGRSRSGRKLHAAGFWMSAVPDPVEPVALRLDRLVEQREQGWRQPRIRRPLRSRADRRGLEAHPQRIVGRSRDDPVEGFGEIGSRHHRIAPAARAAVEIGARDRRGAAVHPGIEGGGEFLAHHRQHLVGAVEPVIDIILIDRAVLAHRPAAPNPCPHGLHWWRMWRNPSR